MEQTREAWLNEARSALADIFREHGASLPEALRLSCGWPATAALTRKNRRIGECWPTECSKDATTEIFISPVLANPIDVLATLAHELVHATVGCQHGHKGPFKRLATAIGLVGKMPATEAGVALRERLNGIAEGLGTYPHAMLDKAMRKKDGTRLKKVMCPTCGYTARITQQWIDQGLPRCPCGTEMQCV